MVFKLRLIDTPMCTANGLLEVTGYYWGDSSMQQWLRTERVRLIAGLLALIAGHQALQGNCALGQQRSFNPVSTMGSVIEPQDLAFESTFTNLFRDNPLRPPVQIAKRVQPKMPTWVAPKTQYESNPFSQPPLGQSGKKELASKTLVRSTPEIVGPNLQGPRLQGPHREGSSRKEFAKWPSGDFDRQRDQLEANAKPLPRVATRVTNQPRAAAKSRGPRSKVQGPGVKGQAKSKPSVKKKMPPLSKQQKQLRAKIRRVLTHYYGRPMNTRDRSPWELMHAMLSFEVHSQVLQGGPKGKPITAVGWMCFNQLCKRWNLMYVNDAGQMRVKVGPALQGHHGQLLAMLAQSSVKKDYPIRIGDEQFSIADLIEMEKQTCYPRTELTFKLISLMHYQDSNAHWLNDQGLEWDIPRLIREELRQPIRGAACGGTHRLTGLTLAYKTRIKRKEPVDGEYLRAKKFVQNYQRYAYRLQNSDGSFSTEWFRGRGDKEDVDRRLKTTGHLLEWLLYAATEKELHSWRTTRAANYLANIMYSNRYRDWEAGPLGHAIHALLLYDRKVFGKYDRWKSDLVAIKPSRH